jgi:hypothetical protein
MIFSGPLMVVGGNMNPLWTPYSFISVLPSGGLLGVLGMARSLICYIFSTLKMEVACSFEI